MAPSAFDTMAKPKCGKGQSCGDSCISAADTCRDKISKAGATVLLQLANSFTSADDQAKLAANKTAKATALAGDRDLDFDQLQAKYAMKAGVANDQVDLGNGWSRWDISHRASDGSGDIMSYSVLQGPGDSWFTLSAEGAKEVTAAGKNAMWQEGRDAALRGIVGQVVAKPASQPSKAEAAATLAAAMPVKQVGTKVPTNGKLLARHEAEARSKFGSDLVDSATANVARILKDDDSQIFIRVGSTATLESILDSGRFKSSAEVGARIAPVHGLDDTYQETRDRVEEHVLGVSKKTKPKDRPIYGYVGLASESQKDGETHREARMYGGISIKLKAEAKGKATFTGADSFKSGIASPMSSPSVSSLLPVSSYGYDLDDPKLAAFSRSTGQNYKDSQGQKLKIAAKAKSLADLGNLAFGGPRYVEAQVHGGVRVQDIDSIDFNAKNKAEMPTDEVLKKAMQAGIKVTINGVAVKPN